IEMMMAKKIKNRYKDCTDLLVDLRALKNGETPPIAHKDVFHADDLASLAAAEAAVQTVIPEDESKRGQKSAMDHLLWPPFLILAALLVLSLILHIVQMAS
ncbi:MAG: hypothetical protein KC996_11495, partial [Phycisphaerales bacterium]|nr:hypothetical protein [Phycisphaerales bacterium]